MKRVLFLFGMIFVAGCSGKFETTSSSASAETSADGGAADPPPDAEPPPWSDASAGGPCGKASGEPGRDGGSVYPHDAAADAPGCPPPPPPPCQSDTSDKDAGAPHVDKDAGAPFVDKDAG